MKKLPLKQVRLFYFLISLIGIICLGIGTFSKSILLLIIGMIVMFGALAFYGIYYRCPWCDKYLDRNTGKYCPWCGKKIR